MGSSAIANCAEHGQETVSSLLMPPELEIKVQTIEVREWRNLRGLEIEIPFETSLVCLVGENGTGKSGLLELVSAAAHYAGLTPGLDLARGNPFDERHDVRVSIQLTRDPESFANELAPDVAEAWDGQVVVTSRFLDEGRTVELVDGSGSSIAAAQVAQFLRGRASNSYLYLDADRAYPPLTFGRHEYGDAMARPWDSENDRRQAAFRRTQTLYDEWLKYMIATEAQAATRLHQQFRRSARGESSRPDFVDPFAAYRDLLVEILPHLNFSGVNQQGFEVLFDTSGEELSFNRLSGGEREIAFLIGQIDRFRLREGLLLVDEPELHLNPDLLRNWIAFLRDTIRRGQVWVATHSLEAVEVAGVESTLVLQRDGETRRVESIKRLADLPVLATLSAAVGSPAFALSSLSFLYVEGERGRASGERERFYALCGNPPDVRVMEAGGSRDVLNKVSLTRMLAEETVQPLVVGGIVDRDFKTDSEVAEIAASPAIHVLGCHEIENVYLHPDAVAAVLDQNGQDSARAHGLVREVSDRFAGAWVFGFARAEVWRNGVRTQRAWPNDKGLRQAAQRDWQRISQDPEAFVDAMRPAEVAWDEADAQLFRDALQAGVREYTEMRDSPALWRFCLGKEVFHALPPRLGATQWRLLEKRILRLWDDGTIVIPDELRAVRSFLGGLNAR